MLATCIKLALFHIRAAAASVYKLTVALFLFLSQLKHGCSFQYFFSWRMRLVLNGNNDRKRICEKSDLKSQQSLQSHILISVINLYDLTMTPFKSIHTEVQISLSQTLNLRNVNCILHSLHHRTIRSNFCFGHLIKWLKASGLLMHRVPSQSLGASTCSQREGGHISVLLVNVHCGQ